MELLEAIKGRRSIHLFKKEAVPNEILRQIFSYASWAPTHYMKESWQVKVYQKAGKSQLIDEIIYSYQRIGLLKSDDSPKSMKSNQSIKDFLHKIPHHAVIYFPIESDPVRYEEEYASVCAFIQNAQLAAWKYNVGMLWTITPYMHDREFVRGIGLDNEEMKIAAVMQIGYPEKVPQSKGRTSINEKLVFIEE